MLCAPLPEEQLGTHAPCATSRQMQESSYGNTQSKNIQTPQRSPDTQRGMKQRPFFSPKRTSLFIGQGFIGILRRPTWRGCSLVSSSSDLLTLRQAGRIRPPRLQIAHLYPSYLLRNLKVLSGPSLHQATHKRRASGLMILRSSQSVRKEEIGAELDNKRNR